MDRCFIEFLDWASLQYWWILGVGQPQKPEMVIAALNMRIAATQMMFVWQNIGPLGIQPRLPYHLPVGCLTQDMYIFLNQRTSCKITRASTPHGLPLATTLLHMKGDSDANTRPMNKVKAKLAMTVLRFMHGHVLVFVFQLQHHIKAKQCFGTV